MSYTIENYMFNDLDLSGNELLTYAFLTSCGVYNDPLEHMKDEVGLKSISTLRNSLRSLEEKGLIKKKSLGSNSPTIYSVVDRREIITPQTQTLILDPNRSYNIMFEIPNEVYNSNKINPKEVLRKGVKNRRSLLD